MVIDDPQTKTTKIEVRKGTWSLMTHRRKRRKWRFQWQPGGSMSELLRKIERWSNKKEQVYYGRLVDIGNVGIFWARLIIFHFG